MRPRKFGLLVNGYWGCVIVGELYWLWLMHCRCDHCLGRSQALTEKGCGVVAPWSWGLQLAVPRARISFGEQSGTAELSTSHRSLVFAQERRFESHDTLNVARSVKANKSQVPMYEECAYITPQIKIKHGAAPRCATHQVSFAGALRLT